MADPYIDQFETQSYGPFAVAQVQSLAIGLDAPFDPLLRHVSGVVTERTAALGALLGRADGHVTVTYKPAPGERDLVADAIDVLRKLEKYASSRDDGDAIADDVLGGRSLTAVARLRPARVPGALDTALKAVQKHQEALPEHAAWTKRLRAAHKHVTDLNLRVRASRSERREMTPEIAAAREAWITAYGSLKLAVESLLRLQGKTRLMPEIFDDLAETHRAAGVSDGEPTPDAPSDPKPLPQG
ncbi:MAG: hypothetical protein JWM10_2733 [Myxococcaceae bacterium]|nr:hypothetical protein [Myxococcaceae bacterium]